MPCLNAQLRLDLGLMGMWSLILALFCCSAGALDRSACGARDLKRKDCRLRLGENNVRLLAATIARENGVWHVVDDLPLKGDGSWEKATFSKINGRLLLQLWLWDVGVGETRVQALHWYVADIQSEKMKLLGEGVVRRRRVKSPSAEFIYDAWEKHSLLPAKKKGELVWTLGAQTKTLPSGDGAHGI